MKVSNLLRPVNWMILMENPIKNGWFLVVYHGRKLSKKIKNIDPPDPGCETNNCPEKNRCLCHAMSGWVHEKTVRWSFWSCTQNQSGDLQLSFFFTMPTKVSATPQRSIFVLEPGVEQRKLPKGLLDPKLTQQSLTMLNKLMICRRSQGWTSDQKSVWAAGSSLGYRLW